MTPHWGEQIIFRPEEPGADTDRISGLRPCGGRRDLGQFFADVRARAEDYSLGDVTIISAPMRKAWDPEFLSTIPDTIVRDARPGQPAQNFYWSGDAAQVGQFVHGAASVWLPLSLLDDDQRPRLVDALARAASLWKVSLHLNKGLAGTEPKVITATRDTATNPAVTQAFALAILGSEETGVYPGVPVTSPSVLKLAPSPLEFALRPLRSALF